MIYMYDDFEFMFLIHKDIDRDAFLQLAGAKQGYARDMFGRMYDSLLRETLDVQEEYQLYYSTEYGNLGKYLYRKWNLDFDQVNEIMTHLKENSDLRLLRRIERSYQGTELRRFMTEDPMIERIEKILLKQ